MKQVVFGVILFGIFLIVGSAFAAETGRKEFDLSGGKRGPVFFPHKIHQKEVGDCMTCHELFPQQEGALAVKISAGELKPKQVMNKSCTRCHRALKKEGKPFGPTSCSKCHRKS